MNTIDRVEIQDMCISLYANALKEWIFLFPSSYGKLLDWTL